MTIKPLNIALEPVKPIKKQPTLIDRCASIAKALFALIASLKTVRFFVNKVIVPLATITSTLAAIILKKKDSSCEEQCIIKDGSSKYHSNVKTIKNFSKELEKLHLIEEKINEDSRYATYVTFNGNSLKNSQKGWVEQLSDFLKKEGFSEHKILNVLKSIEIQIFDCVLKDIIHFIESENHIPVTLLNDSIQNIFDTKTAVSLSKGSKHCLIEQNKGMNLYGANVEKRDEDKEYKAANVEAFLGKLFLKITVAIAKDPDQVDQLSYVWNMNEPTDERLRFISEREDLLKD